MSLDSIDNITPEMIKKAQQVFDKGTSSTQSHDEDPSQDTAAEIGAVISTDMVKKGLSIDDIAKKLDTSPAFVNQCLNRHGVHNFSAE
ncbi:hypothetical protein [Phytohalomonas tamaricis]|uniref:hypothetical protein n=1 Tax=Phytohalomonas tamaricis TaxID=2081032 RepID=UPI000D0B78BC|nr:hypothetical protein [Phytohalomonas tamaricis]